MRINTQEVRDTAAYIKEAQTQLNQTKNTVVQVRNKIDQRIILRSSVNSVLNQSISGLEQIENRLQAIDSFLMNSATLYELNENQLQQKFRDINRCLEIGAIYQLTQDNSQYSLLRKETNNQLDLLKGYKTTMEWLSGEKYSGILKGPLAAISNFDLVVDVIKGVQDLGEQDPSQIYSSIRKIGQKVLTKLDKPNQISIQSVGKSFLIDTMITMATAWNDGIVKFAQTGEGTAGEVVWATTGDAVIKAGARAVEAPYKLATATAFYCLDQIDNGALRNSYENLSEKKGFDAVIDVQKQLWVDEIYEKQIKPAAGKAIDNFYKGVSDTWNNWTTGCGLLGKAVGEWLK